MSEPVKNQLPLTRIQKLIGTYMLQSKQTKANGYLRMRADLTELAAMRKAYCKKTKCRVTTNNFFIYAIARSIMKYPLIAATIDESMENLVISDRVGVGFAVAAPQGLVVPVVQNMNEKTLPQIAEESDLLLKKARSNKLNPDDFDGANIVLSGLGMYGIESFYAISPPSATGIISIGNFEDAVIPMGDGFETRKMMYVSFAFDQRLVDEFYAVDFLRNVVGMLENPEELTTDV
ncbi:MAG TPA: 2-oxo acid dehydrogenase subunit E2 [Alphaproteobacteria bacterium]|nr:2-oxo acid dehydrogenase subunit E2 [Alphaproteobacteria bacterium]